MQGSLTPTLLCAFHRHISFVFFLQKTANSLSQHVILILKLIVLSLVVIRLSLLIELHQLAHPRIHHKQINLVLLEFVDVCAQTRHIGLQLLDYGVRFSMKLVV